MAKGDIVDLPTKAIEQLGLSPPVKEALLAVQADLSAAYQKSFIEMVQAINRQASALDRLQTTLNILVEHLAPQLKGHLPLAVRLAEPGETPDIASALVTADPIGAGYTLTQANLAEALGLPPTDVSILCKAFKLADDGECAVVVRKGKQNDTVNYHPRAIERFKELVAEPPSGLTAGQTNALKRVTRRLVAGGAATSPHPKT